MDFTIIPYVGGAPLPPQDTKVWIPPEYEKYAHSVVLEVRKLTEIKDEADRDKVVEARKQMQSILSQVESARKAAKTPIDSIANAIQDAARGVTDEVELETERLDGLIQAAGNAEQARRDAEVRAVHEAHRLEIEAKQAEVLRLQEEQQKLMIDAGSDEDLFRARETRTKAAALEKAARDAAVELASAEDTVVIEPQFRSPLIKGASMPEQIDPEIEDESLFIQALNADLLSDKPIGLIKIIKLELRLQAAKDLVNFLRKQHKSDPNFDVKAECANIGMKVSIYRKPRTRQASKVIRETY